MNWQRVISCAVFALLSVVFAFPVGAQTAGCDDGSLSDADGYKVRSVKVGLRFAAVPRPAKGAAYTKAGESKLLSDVRDAIKADENRETVVGSTISQLTGKLPVPFSARMITSCVKIVEEKHCQAEVGQAKCVDISVSARTLRFSLDAIAENLLDAVPRSNEPTIVGGVPAALLALNPDFKTGYDKDLGFTQGVEFSTDLLNVSQVASDKTAAVRSVRLDLKAGGEKSLNENFYTSDISLALSKTLSAGIVEKVSAVTRFSASRLPSGKADLFDNTVAFGGGVSLKPGAPGIKTIDLEGLYTRSYNRFSSPDPTLTQNTIENGFSFRALTDGRVSNGVLRTGVWADGAGDRGAVSSFRRVAALVGYAKDIGKGTETFGLETMFGIGRATGNVPAHGLFYGSSELKNFVYEARESDVLYKMPAGPVMRSFGSGQSVSNTAGVTGGSRSYWHFNLNLSVPVKKWSAPLIPDERVELDTDEANPACPIATIRDLIKCQAASGATILGAIYKQQGVPNFAEKAKQEFKDINSAVGFLVDHSNLYSVKPLFMFDAANFNSPTGSNETRFGAGGGMQLNIVIAKFEAGYMRTVNPQPGDSRGNFIMRLYFQNLF